MRPYRSLLFVPTHKQGWAAKAASARADALILDLEDAVPADQKALARETLPGAVAEARAARPNVGIVVRANHWSTPYAADDYATIARCDVDAVMVPKVESAHELVRLDAVLEFLERLGHKDEPVEFVATLETAKGVANCTTIAAAPRVAGVLSSAARDADIARSVGFTWTPGGSETLFLRSAVIIASRAVPNCHPTVGLWQDIKDLDGLRTYAQMQRDLGFLGQVLIHPSHVEIVNEVFTPSPETVARYKGMLAAYDEAVANGRGAVVYDGEHVDEAHATTAREVVEFAEQIAALD